MGFFDSFSSFKGSNESPEDTGRRALELFYRAAQPELGSLTFGGFLEQVRKANRLTIPTLGNGIELADASISQVEDAMRKAGKSSKGLIPANPQVLISVLNNRLQELDLTGFVEISSNVVEDLGEVGKEAVDLVEKGFDSAVVFQVAGLLVALIGLFK